MRWFMLAALIAVVGSFEVWLVGLTHPFGRPDFDALVSLCLALAVASASAGALACGLLRDRGRRSAPPADEPPQDDGSADKAPDPPEPGWWPDFERDFRDYSDAPPPAPRVPVRVGA